MESFNFITDEQFRASLESDHKEMHAALKSEAWKSVHVMAGSIVEALLVDHLVAAGHCDRDSGLKIDLAAAVELAREHNVIDQRIAELSSVVRSYRNLIHPGRVIRLGETVDDSSARVAAALVTMVLRSIEKKRRESYGYTAEQIVVKLENDSGADAILKHILDDAKAVEIERLLTRALPNRLMQCVASPLSAPDHLRGSLRACFLMAFETANDALRRRVADGFATLLKEGTDVEVAAYRDNFFTTQLMEYMTDADAQMVKEHLLSSLRKAEGVSYLRVLNGIGPYLTAGDAKRFVDGMAVMVLGLDPESTDMQVARRFMGNLVIETKGEFDQKARGRLAAVAEKLDVEHFGGGGNVRDLAAAFDLPF